MIDGEDEQTDVENEDASVQNEENKAGNEYKGNNFASHVSDNLSNLADNAGKLSDGLKNQARKQDAKAINNGIDATINKGTQAGVKATERMQRAEKRSKELKQAAEKLKKVKEKAEKFSKIAAKIGKWIALIGWIILIIMVIIGILVFIITGWGMIMNSIKGLVEKFFDVCIGLINGNETVVHEDEVVDLMDTIEEMGYDLYGYGFVTSREEIENEAGEKEDKYYEAVTETDEQTITEVSLLESLKKKDAYRNIIAYLISDNYAYYIKNHNFNFRTMKETGFLGNMFNSTEWGSGLISIYKQKDGAENKITGKRGQVYGSLMDKVEHGAALGSIGGKFFPGASVGGLIEGVMSVFKWDQITSSIKIDRQAKQLNITASGIFSNQKTTYNLDGWTGRYSMPLEFLLSTHIATMAPDLSYKLATSFNTDVEILLYTSSNDSLEGGIRAQDGTVYKYSTFADACHTPLDVFNDRGIDLQEAAGWSLTQAAAHRIFEQCPSLNSQTEGEYKCTNNPTCSEAIRSGNPYKLWFGQKATCNACQQYLQLLFSAVGQVTEDKFDIFVPYINCVTDHWFRNVYFTSEALKAYNEEHSNKDSLIQRDEDYYLATGEMWTVYEKDDKDEYELYVYLKENEDYKNDFEQKDGKYLVCRKEAGGPYGISEKAGNLYEKKKNGGYNLYLLDNPDADDKDKTYTAYEDKNIEEFRVGKKAITKKEEDTWNVYDIKNIDPSWKEVEVKEDTSKEIKKVKELGLATMYSMQGTEITQVEDGVRGETNAKIKKLFLDDYYLYDGTGSTAALIEKAKEMAGGSDDPDEFISKNGEDKEIKATYKGKDYKGTIKDISGPINILQNSLTAFSMLKNLHTLDAEYIYHDFKELIVELDYFDKEDLTEAEEEVMMFPIANISSAGWPMERYDKGEEYYGTLIHSVEDYKALKAETELKLEEMRSQEIDEETKQALQEIAQEKKNITNNSNADTNTDNAGTVGTMSLSVSGFVNFAKTCHDEQTHKSYAYGGGSYPTKSTEATVDCSHYVSCVLYDAGIYTGGYMTSRSMPGVLEGLGGQKVTDKTQLQAGDICFYGSDEGNTHVDIFVEYKNGVMYGYNCGGNSSVQAKDVTKIDRDDFQYAIRLPLTGSNMVIGSVAKEFEGYEGGEPVLSPVTGEVIKYGTVDRKNIETGNKEEVGFIKIRVLGSTEAKPGSKNGCTFFEDKGYNYFWEEYSEAGITDHVLYIEGFDVSKILNDIDSDNSVKGENIKSLKSYIEVDETKGEDLKESKYTTEYTVPAVVDNDKAEELVQQETDKKDAKYTTTVETKNKKGKKQKHIYIKEGAVIGHTYEQDDVDTIEREIQNEKYNVGNYIRFIFRDVKDQVVENVEDYMEIEEPVVVIETESGPQEYQASEGDAELLAKIICLECCATGQSSYIGEQQAEIAAKATGYVILNRALVNFEGHGTTIEAQLNVESQYAERTRAEIYSKNPCRKCIVAAEFCLSNDCSSISNSRGEQMSKMVLFQSGNDQCHGECWEVYQTRPNLTYICISRKYESYK